MAQIAGILTRTSRFYGGKPVYTAAGRFEVRWHVPTDPAFGTRQGWLVLDTHDELERPGSDQFDPIYGTHDTLRSAALEVASRLP